MTLNGDVLQFSFIACSLNDFEVIMKPTNYSWALVDFDNDQYNLQYSLL
jgi:hypothetical protein